MGSSDTDVSPRLGGRIYLYRLLDAAIVLAAGIATSQWYFTTDAGAPPIHLFLVYLCSLAAFAFFPAFGLYASWRGRRLIELVMRCAVAWASVFAFGILLAFLVHQIGAVSRLAAGAWLASAGVLLIGLRMGIFFLLRLARDHGLNKKRVLIVGFGALGHDLWRRADHFRTAGYEVAGIYAREHEQLPIGARRLESLDVLPAFVHSQSIREIWIALPMEASQHVRDVLHNLRNELVDIRWIPDVTSIELLGHRMGEFLGLPTIHLNSLPAVGIRGTAKGIFDRVFAFFAVLMLSPIMLSVALAVKLSSRGPVLFTQPRLGVDGEVFKVYKFRTMTMHQEQGVVTQATRDDVRITRVGAFLRKTSLDELPQFFNVLRGEMSVVGPRPHALEHNEFYKDIVARYMMRHRVKPGITGWAQVNGYRGQTDTVSKMSDRVEFDIYYIQHWTFLMDIQIIARTAFSGWTGKNVY